MWVPLGCAPEIGALVPTGKRARSPISTDGPGLEAVLGPKQGPKKGSLPRGINPRRTLFFNAHGERSENPEIGPIPGFGVVKIP